MLDHRTVSYHCNIFIDSTFTKSVVQLSLNNLYSIKKEKPKLFSSFAKPKMSTTLNYKNSLYRHSQVPLIKHEALFSYILQAYLTNCFRKRTVHAITIFGC